MEKQLLKACENGTLYDFIASEYYQMSKDQLKEVILGMLCVVSDNGSDENYHSFEKLVATELKEERGFGEE